MNLHQVLPGLVNEAVRQKTGLAVWFLPGKSEVNALLAAGDEILIPSSSDDFLQKNGFVFSPFRESNAHPSIFLKQGIFLNGIDKIATQSSFPQLLLPPNKEVVFESSRDEYMQSCKNMIGRIKSGEAGKVVLSRIEQVENRKEKHPADVLIDLKDKNPQAFCYLFFTPQTGLWTGATPETLMAVDEDTIKTMALAGTRPHRPEDSATKPWPEKEIAEQQYVSDFIREELNKLGIHEMMISPSYTSPAGNIEHIRTDFVIRKSDNVGDSGKILNALHPTPAVCGFPKEKALNIIQHIEKHDRAYYSGFLGPVNLQGDTRLFVNLRCAKAESENFLVFVGGGITADSVPESEWEETELKASALEKIISND